MRSTITANGGAGASINSSSISDGVIDFGKGTRQLITQLPTGGQIESRVVAGVLYTQLPAALGAQPGRKPWVKVTVPAGLASSSGDDPTKALGFLRGAARSIRKVGTEQVRGAATTHYTSEIDLTKLAAEASASPAPGQPDAGALLRKLLGRDTLPLEIWVDAQQRVRRLQTTLPTSGAAGQPPAGSSPSAPASPASTGRSTSIEEFYDFGVAVDVQAPPPDQVQDPAATRPPVPPPASAPAPPAAAPTASPTAGPLTS